jgi:hypothetical protein
MRNRCLCSVQTDSRERDSDTPVCLGGSEILRWFGSERGAPQSGVDGQARRHSFPPRARLSGASAMSRLTTYLDRGTAACPTPLHA